MKKKNLINSVVQEVLEDFKRRQEERKGFENQWQLNMNFFMGNQYCTIGYGGKLQDFDKQYFWQEREVFNHIAPIIENRLSKLGKIKPLISVVPATNDAKDVKSAQISKKIISALSSKIDLNQVIDEATKWSEICGTVFYKIVWNNELGQTLAVTEEGKKIRGGDVDISVCSPFEIFPDSVSRERIEDCESIIHAKAFSVDEVKRKYGIEVLGQEVNIFSLDTTSYGFGGLGYSFSANKIAEGVKKDSVVVLEKYIRPNIELPNGRLIIIAGDVLIYDGDMPYENGSEREREFPFVMQKCMNQPASFWGVSVIDRVIPVQRAYNAVKNRKHEFLNRLSMGVLNVEDGSVDLDNLEDEGLCPGKILVYRQGSKAPSYLTGEQLSGDFAEEEKKLLDEFANISGVSDITEERFNTSNLSGTALEILIEQYQQRLSSASDNMKNAIKMLAKQVLRLYKQFAKEPRLARIAGDNYEIDMFYFNANDISSDDIRFEAEDDLGENVHDRREMIFNLIDKGLLSDDGGRMTKRMKIKVLELLGYGLWENAQDQSELHIRKADKENLDMLQGKFFEPSEIDENEIHINEHICFMLSKEYEEKLKKDEKIEEIFLKHIRKHKIMKKRTEIEE